MLINKLNNLYLLIYQRIDITLLLCQTVYKHVRLVLCRMFYKHKR